eukprot:1144222-Pelagomonas_calceolata.AAC.3
MPTLTSVAYWEQYPQRPSSMLLPFFWGHSHTATDSLSSLHQIRKQTLHPELHLQHVQGHVLKKLIQLVRNSPTPVYLYKIKSYAGIAGKECTDAIAKLYAIQDDGTPADTTFPCVNLEDNPFHGTTWLAFEESARTHASTFKRPNSPALKLKQISNLHDALRTHMHLKHRLGKANTETGKKAKKKLRRQRKLSLHQLRKRHIGSEEP